MQTDRVDKSAVGWDDKEKLQQHESQKGCHSAVNAEDTSLLMMHKGSRLYALLIFRSFQGVWREIRCADGPSR